MKVLNLNSSVRVKLTEYGKQRDKERHADLYKDTPNAPYYLPPEDENGYSTWQLWHLMLAFGEFMSIGQQLPMLMDIQIQDDDLRDVVNG